MRKALSALLVMTGALTASAVAVAEDDQARSWAATCTGCYGTEGRSQGAIPPIAGKSSASLQSLMHEFKNDERPATVMHQIAKGYSDAQIVRICDYFAARRP